MKLNIEDQQHLLGLAREAITTCLRQGRGTMPPLPPGLSSTLGQSDGSGAFVTLHLHHRLRGCIGVLESNLSLAGTVRRMALAAALDDPRFPALTVSELPHIAIEISVLSPKRLVKDVHEIELGEDGIVVEGQGRHGVFLPQVAPENNWDLETFLGECCEHKAGLPRLAWKTGQTRIYAFRAQVFGEK